MASGKPQGNAVDVHPKTSADLPRPGISYRLALEHIFTYPGTYQQIPLRTMYTLNSAPRSPMLSSRPSTPLSRDSSSPPASPGLQQATAHFSTALITHITSLPSQPCSLPPSFITTFLRRCFPAELELVDFPQAITGLDYLHDLETRRRRNIASALGRIGLNGDNIATHADVVCAKYPEVREWLQSLQRGERQTEALYTQLFVALRRWILINEFSLLPFHKHNCVAMLNTLYPPSLTSAESSLAGTTAMLTSSVLKEQRDGFFSWIGAVERKGPSVLQPLMQQGKKPGHESGWTAVQETLDAYLRVANSMIDDASAIVPEAFDNSIRRKGGKADSGVSFTGPSRASTDEDRRQSSKRSAGSNRPLSPFPELDMQENLDDKPVVQPVEQTQSRPDKGLSTLEKIARELRKIRGKRRNNQAYQALASAKPPADVQAPPPPLKESSGNKSLRKLKSLGDLKAARAMSNRRRAAAAESSRQSFEFDTNEMLRQQLIWEAKASKRMSLEQPGLQTTTRLD